MCATGAEHNAVMIQAIRDLAWDGIGLLGFDGGRDQALRKYRKHHQPQRPKCTVIRRKKFVHTLI